MLLLVFRSSYNMKPVRRRNRSFRAAYAGLIMASISVVEARPMPLGTKDQECYGEIVDIILVNQMTGEPKVPLHIPIAAKPSVTNYSPNDEERDPSQSCMTEPILANSVYFYLSHLPELSAALGFTANEPTVRRFELHYSTGLSQSFYDSKLQRAIRAAAEEKTEVTPEGFTRIYRSEGNSGEYGEYIAPKPYSEPSGLPLQFFCFPSVFASECNIRYWIPGDVVMSYWFLTDKTKQADWIALDQSMRRVVGNMIDKAYLGQWKDTTRGVQ